MKQKKRILVLTPRFPYPVIGGDRLRIYQICKALARDYSLTLLSLCERRADMGFQIPNDGVFYRVERVRLPKAQSLANVLAAVPSQRPLQVGYFHSPRFANAVRRLLPDHDAVLCHLVRSAAYVRGVQIPKILEMTDAISMNYERVCQQKGALDLRGQIYGFEHARLRRFERQIIEDFDLTTLVSPVDRDYLTSGQHRDDVMIASMGVDLDRFAFQPRPHSKPVITYIGKMTTMQNMHAALFFAQACLPLIRQRVDARFRVVGLISDADRRKLSQFDGVDVTGAVDSIPDAVADARIGVCPVQLGAGVQTKVLEYMALGLPVITSSVGREGIDAKVGQEILVADTPGQFADEIERLWHDAPLRATLAHKGRAFVERHHPWQVQLRPLVQRVHKLLGEDG